MSCMLYVHLYIRFLVCVCPYVYVCVHVCMSTMSSIRMSEQHAEHPRRHTHAMHKSWNPWDPTLHSHVGNHMGLAMIHQTCLSNFKAFRRSPESQRLHRKPTHKGYRKNPHVGLHVGHTYVRTRPRMPHRRPAVQGGCGTSRVELRPPSNLRMPALRPPRPVFKNAPLCAPRRRVPAYKTTQAADSPPLSSCSGAWLRRRAWLRHGAQ